MSAIAPKPPRRMLLRSAFAVVAAAACVQPALADPKKGDFKTAFQKEAKDRAACEALSDRIFITSDGTSECVAYIVTRGLETNRRAVVFFDGDVEARHAADTEEMARSFEGLKRLLQLWSDNLKVRFVAVSRLGLNGSSGNHGERRSPHETLIMDAAIDVLKTRLGIDRVALAGQSGGAAVSASILSLGRSDVSCAVLGSGAYSLVDLHHATLASKGRKVARERLDDTMFDPLRDADLIVTDPKRRIFIVGDEVDTRTPVKQQMHYLERLKSLGHHAVMVPVKATGEHNHVTTRYVLPTAGGCLTGASDANLLQANATLTAKTVEEVTPQPLKVPSAAVALMRSSSSRED
jgi:pimeloyl-ACP methyl ester carboxylesterase